MIKLDSIVTQVHEKFEDGLDRILINDMADDEDDDDDDMETVDEENKMEK